MHYIKPQAVRLAVNNKKKDYHLFTFCQLFYNKLISTNFTLQAYQKYIFKQASGIRRLFE